jgi:hypothetical protein
MSLKILQDKGDGIIVPNSKLDINVRLDISHLFKMIGRWKFFKITSHGKIKCNKLFSDIPNIYLT